MSERTGWLQKSVHDAYHNVASGFLQKGGLFNANNDIGTFSLSGNIFTSNVQESLEIYRVVLEQREGLVAITSEVSIPLSAGISCSNSLPEEMRSQWPHYAGTRQAQLKIYIRSERELKSSDEFTKLHDRDVVLIFPGNLQDLTSTTKYLLARKHILVKVSPYFESLFASGFAESNTFTFDAPSIDSFIEVIQKRKFSASNSTVVGNEIKQLMNSSAKSLNSSSERMKPSTTSTKFHGVIITEASYESYLSFLYFITNGQIFFARLESLPELEEAEADSQPSESISPSNILLKNSLTVSPESIYRLADFLTIPKLQEKALQSFTSQLTSENIIGELFGTFASSYDVVYEATLLVAKGEWKQALESDGMKKLQEEMSEGKIEPLRLNTIWKVLMETTL